MIIQNGLVFCENGQFESKDVAIQNGRFAETSSDGRVIDAGDGYVIPGLVDIHFHGAAGHDFCGDDPGRVEKITRYELKNGITSVCPTTCTVPADRLEETCRLIGAFAQGGMSAQSDPHPDCARVFGIHLEGPFLSFEKKGAHNPYDLMPADPGLLSRLQEAAGGLVRLLAIAPEIPGGMELIRQVAEDPDFQNIHTSLAHTTAGYALATEAFRAGSDHITHMFNAMPVFGHREPGVIGAALDWDKCFVELIGDGIHVSPTVVRAAFSMFPTSRIVLISDTIQPCGLGDGTCVQGGLEVSVSGKYARLKDGTIAGSVTNLMNGLRSVVSMGIPLEKAVLCATYNPARSLGMEDQIGSIAPGKLGDCVILDRELNIQTIIKGGAVV